MSLYDGVDDKIFLDVLFDVMEEHVVENFEDIMGKVHDRLTGKLTGVQGVHMSKEKH